VRAFVCFAKAALKEETVATHGKCPTCRRELRTTQLQRALEVIEATSNGPCDNRIARFGSKLHAVSNQLVAIWQTEPEAKVIVFLQFELLLHKAEAALKELSLPCMTLKGSVFERRKIIRQFHAPGQEHRVLLISLEKSPSGMNLVCCHHLILVHPMHADSREAALSYERLAGYGGVGSLRRCASTDSTPRTP
jgi:hypothetical protein